MNITILLLSSCIPLVLGTLWYHPRVFGSTWQRVARLRPEELRGRKRWMVVLLSLIFGFFISVLLLPITIHQFGFYSSLAGIDNHDGVKLLRSLYEGIAGHTYRTFRHGAFHGFLAGAGLALPVLALTALLERRSYKYAAVHAAYWMICFALVGGIVCRFFELAPPK